MTSTIVPTRRARDAMQIMTETAEAIWPAVAAAVRTLNGPVRSAALRHFGWMPDGVDCRPSGKALRPTLALLSAEAFDGRRSDALSVAVAIELVHNGTLIHDDLIDGDGLRRGRPALWSEIGEPGAVLAGDALFFLAIETAPPSAAPILAATVQELIFGEFQDVLFSDAVTVPVSEVEAMARAKTAPLFAAAARLGAVAADAPDGASIEMAAFGGYLGEAFQIADDLLGIWGDPRRTGKPAGSDVASRKKSLPVIYAMASGSPAGQALIDLYARPSKQTMAEAHEVADLIEATGARNYCLERLRDRSELALGHLDAAGPNPVVREEIAQMMRRFIERDR